ncbi:MAG: hypothetical protein K5675_07165 [Lachnospiraceae bacterium]|nr:hypothetical protein [Lachnospiraceae bacterium]
MKQEELMRIQSIVEDGKNLSYSEKKEYFQTEAFHSESVSVLEQLSYYRENLYNWYPFQSSDRVLVLGCECGYLTDFLCQKVKKVVCVEQEKIFSDICNSRFHQYENFQMVIVDHLLSFAKDEKEEYDIIICDHGIEKYGEALFEVLKELCKSTTTVFVSGSNRLGMKYWNGAQTKQYPNLFAGLQQDYVKVEHRLYSRKEYIKLFARAGFVDDIYEYYPYPDEVFPTAIYSENRLPKVGELNKQLRDFSEKKVSFFKENEAFDVVIEQENFPEFSNGLLFVLQVK